MIDVSELVADPDFAQTFSIERFTGSFANEGEYTEAAPTVLSRTGAIQPGSSPDMLEFLPEGERGKATIRFWSWAEIRMGDGLARSDNILWRGRWYRVAYCKPWQLNGYYHGIAVEFAHD